MAFILGAFYFFYFSVVGIHIIFMPKVFEMVGYSPSKIGILFAAAPLVRFILPFLFLRFIALTPKVFNLSIILTFLSTLLFYPFLQNFGALLVTNILMGVGMSLSSPYVESFALTHMPKERYGRVRLFGSIGFILVALILVNYLNNPLNAIIFLNVTTFCTLIFGLFIARMEKHHSQSNPAQTEGGFNLLAHWPLWLSLFLMQVAFGGFYNFFTIYASSYDLSIPTLGIDTMDMTIYLWSFGVICEVFMLYFQAPLLKNNLLKVLQFSIGITVFRWLILALFPEHLLLLFIAQSIHAFSFALYHSAAIMTLHQLYSNKKLSQQFFAGIAYGLGGFSGAVISGFIYEISARGLYFTTAFITFVSLLFLNLEQRRTSVDKP